MSLNDSRSLSRFVLTIFKIVFKPMTLSVYKFRRRSRFLELYVRVLEKAMLESRPDLVIGKTNFILKFQFMSVFFLDSSKTVTNYTLNFTIYNLKVLKSHFTASQYSIFSPAIDWCSEAGAWLRRRNELLISPRVQGKGGDAKTKESKPEV